MASEFAAIIPKRPLLLLAKATAVLAGARRLNFPTFVTTSDIGAIPTTVLYAVVSVGIWQKQTLIAFVVTYLLVAGTAFATAKFLQRKLVAEKG